MSAPKDSAAKFVKDHCLTVLRRFYGFNHQQYLLPWCADANFDSEDQALFVLRSELNKMIVKVGAIFLINDKEGILEYRLSDVTIKIKDQPFTLQAFIGYPALPYFIPVYASLISDPMNSYCTRFNIYRAPFYKIPYDPDYDITPITKYIREVLCVTDYEEDRIYDFLRSVLMSTSKQQCLILVNPQIYNTSVFLNLLLSQLDLTKFMQITRYDLDRAEMVNFNDAKLAYLQEEHFVLTKSRYVMIKNLLSHRYTVSNRAGFPTFVARNQINILICVEKILKDDDFSTFEIKDTANIEVNMIVLPRKDIVIPTDFSSEMISQFFNYVLMRRPSIL
nr:hypothetical protein [Abalone asfa-like virus]